jgi:YD repeat-containing protein
MLPVRSVINARSSMQERRAAQVVRQGADSGKLQALCQGFGLLRRIVLQLLLALALCAGLSVTAHAQVQHIYDENGRLVGTTDPTGNAARFTYDAAGNITAIARFTSTQVSIIEFTPNSGPGSSTVTIWGTGFSATPASNTVTFNGAAGTVTAATVNKLTVTVPGGATTGVIAVTSLPPRPFPRRRSRASPPASWQQVQLSPSPAQDFSHRQRETSCG